MATKLTREDINFSSGKSSDEGRGYGNANPKISFQIKGVQKKWKALYRGDCWFGGLLQDKVTEFLESDEMKDWLIDRLYKGAILEEKREEMRANYIARCDELFTEKDPWPNFDDFYGNKKREKEQEAWQERKNAAYDQAELEVYGKYGQKGNFNTLRQEIFGEPFNINEFKDEALEILKDNSLSKNSLSESEIEEFFMNLDYDEITALEKSAWDVTYAIRHKNF